MPEVGWLVGMRWLSVRVDADAAFFIRISAYQRCPSPLVLLYEGTYRASAAQLRAAWMSQRNKSQKNCARLDDATIAINHCPSMVPEGPTIPKVGADRPDTQT
ncbi:unnamed protein product [Rhizoctonia solani]|uniref:Uncharacterized protein n=1 Tax=Rhizoctonia solani TaxID=456999 RepID=A0A8H2X1G7_9AGAM|nr:unnamed protein product [Rhizoctonia solani]